MKYHAAGSIRSFLSIPQLAATNHAGMDLQDASSRIKTLLDASDEVNPDVAAVEFYTLNHLASVVMANFDKDEILPEWAQKVMKSYADCVAEQGGRMYSYLLLICTREARHAGSKGAIWNNVLPKYSTHPHLISWLQALPPDSSSSAKIICTKAPKNVELGMYVNSLVDIFMAPGGWGGGYGGKKWGAIAKCLHDFVTGKTSLELMVDSAYSLSHNNGPIFNKGMLYGHYSSHFIKILDVQRSGQMPEAVLSDAFAWLSLEAGMARIKELVKDTRKAFPNAFDTEVDWHKVEKLGSVHKYETEKKAQKKKVPTEPIMIEGKKVLETGEFVIMPGVSVVTYKRVG